MPISNPVSNITDKQENNTRAPSKELRVNPETGTYESSKVEFRKPVYSGGKRVGYREVTDKGESKQVVVENPENVPQDIIKPQPKPSPKTNGINVNKDPYARGAFIPSVAFAEASGSDLYLSKPQPVAQQPQPREEISPEFAQRIETLTQREQRLNTFKQAVYEKWGIVKTKEEEQISLANPAASVRGVAKTIAQQPIEIASLPSYIGGRVGFIIEAKTNEAGKQELSRASGQVIPSIISSYDPTTTSGLTNIFLTGYAVKGTQATIKNKFFPDKVKVIGEEKGIGQRIVTKEGQVLDRVTTKRTFQYKGKEYQVSYEMDTGFTKTGLKETSLEVQGKGYYQGKIFDIKSGKQVGTIEKTPMIFQGEAQPVTGGYRVVGVAVDASKNVNILASRSMAIGTDTPTKFIQYDLSAQYRNTESFRAATKGSASFGSNFENAGSRIDVNTKIRTTETPLTIENLETGGTVKPYIDVYKLSPAEKPGVNSYTQDITTNQAKSFESIKQKIFPEAYNIADFNKQPQLLKIGKKGSFYGQTLEKPKPINSPETTILPSENLLPSVSSPSFIESISPKTVYFSGVAPTITNNPSPIITPTSINRGSLVSGKKPALVIFTPESKANAGILNLKESNNNAFKTSNMLAQSSSFNSENSKISASKYEYLPKQIVQENMIPNSFTPSPVGVVGFNTPISNLPPFGGGFPKLSPTVEYGGRRKKGGKQKKKYRPDLIGRVLNIKAPKGTKKGMQSGFTVRGI